MSGTTGYSGKPLIQKLGFKPGWRVFLSNAPASYPELLGGGEDVTFETAVQAGPFQGAHLFFDGPEVPADGIEAALRALAPGGMLWVSWAKKSSKRFSGLTEDHMRAAILPTGWVDTKVCAVDVDWSALKFLKRRAT